MAFCGHHVRTVMALSDDPSDLHIIATCGQKFKIGRYQKMTEKRYSRKWSGVNCQKCLALQKGKQNEKSTNTN